MSNKSKKFPVLFFFICGLTTTFIVLKAAKITAVADWSWVWVFSPIWICFLIGMGIFFVIAFVIALGTVLSEGK